MALENKSSPEKELLKLIERPVSKGSLQVEAIKHRGLSLLSFGALKGRWEFLKGRFKDLKTGGLQQFDAKALNKALGFSIFILVSYFAVSLTTSIMHLRKPLDLTLKGEKDSEERLTLLPSLLKATAYYLEKARDRDLFSMGKRTLVQIKGPSSRIIEATQNLKLVGISWSADPDVMIEDTQSKKTLFLKKGQFIDNNIKVEAVFKDKVILSFKGEEIELE